MIIHEIDWLQVCFHDIAANGYLAYSIPLACHTLKKNMDDGSL